MLLLAIDTATEATSVALHDGDEVLVSLTHVDARRHAELLAPMIGEALALGDRAMADITSVAVGVGPGPYTGLRVGIATARAIGLARGIGVVGVCSLDALAATATDRGLPGSIVVATDARRREVYWADYDAGVRVEGPLVGSPQAIPVEGRLVVGSGAVIHGLAAPDAPAYPDSGSLASLAIAFMRNGGTVPALAPTLDDPRGNGRGVAVPFGLLEARPLYLRRPDATEPGATS